jgi:WD40 repeat protein
MAMNESGSGDQASGAITERFDVFISFAAADKEWAEGFLLVALTTSGIRCCIIDDFPAGMPLLEASSRAVEMADRIVVVLSPAYVSDHAQQFITLLGQHFGTEQLTWPVIPILLRPTELPLRLRVLNPLQATSRDEWGPVVERLCRELEHPLIKSDAAPACPYRGMRPYEEDDKAAFYGREAEIEEALSHLRLNPWLFVVGASGSGKSSLIRAGLIPRLRQFGYEPTIMRPGSAPLTSLSNAQIALTSGTNYGKNPLLFVDQFEEIFTTTGDGTDSVSQTFWRGLQSAMDGAPTRIVATVRADYYPQLMNPDIWPVVKQHRMEIVPVTGHALHESIVAPAETVGVYVENSLVDKLIEDSDKQPGSLPFLQETLVLLWERLEYRFLPMSAYEALVLPRVRYGDPPRTGLQVAMANRADAVMAALPSDEARIIAQRTFLRLVQFVEGREDVRRQQSRDSLASADDDPELFATTLNTLIAAHLLTATASESDSTTQVDLSHEALILGWPSLREWINQRRTAELTRRDLEAQASTWIRLGKGQGGLLDDVELREAERWRSSTDAAQLGASPAVEELLSASGEAIRQDQQRRRRTDRIFRGLSAALAVFLLAAVVLGLAAKQQTKQAVSERKTAQSGELAITAATLPETQLDRALLLSQEAVRLRATSRSYGGELAALRSNPRIIRMVHFDAPLTTMARSRDGTLLAVGDILGKVMLIGSHSAYEIQHTMSIPGKVHSVAFSPDGAFVAAAGSTGVVQEWSTADGSPHGPPMTGHTGSVRAVAYSPDGRWIVTGGIDSRVLLRPRGPGSVRVLVGHRDWLNAFAFTADSSYLISAGGRTEHESRDGRTLIWDMATGRQVRALPDQGDAVRSLALVDDQTLVAAGADGRVRIWDIKSGSRENVLTGHVDRVFGVAVSADGSVIASAGRDEQIRLWSRTGRQVAPPLIGHGAAVRSVVQLDDGEFVTAGDDARLIFWAPTGVNRSRLLQGLDDPNRPVRAVAVNAEADLVAEGNDDGTVTLRRASDLASALVHIQTGGNLVWGIAFSPHGDKVATTTARGVLQLWDTRTGRSLAGPIETGEDAPVIAISPDGAVIATGGYGKNIHLWDNQLRALGPPLVGHNNGIAALAFRESDGALISAGYDSTIWMWSGIQSAVKGLPPTGRMLAASTSGLVSLAVCQSGKTVISGDRDGDIIIWDPSSTNASRIGRPLLRGHKAAVTALTCSEDGHSLLSADEAGVVRLWDLTNGGREVGELGQGAPAHTGALVPAGDRFLVGTDTGMSAWVIDPNRWASIACQVAGRNLQPGEQQDYLQRDRYAPTCPNLPSPPPAAPAPAPDGP